MAASSSETYATKASVASKSEVAMPSSFGKEGNHWPSVGAVKCMGGRCVKDHGCVHREFQSSPGDHENGGLMVAEGVAVGMGGGPYFTMGLYGTPYIGCTVLASGSIKSMALASGKSAAAEDASAKEETTMRLAICTPIYSLILTTHDIYNN
jgi:hypothetical protein